MSQITVNNARVVKHVGTNGAFQIVETYNGDWSRYWTVWNKAEGAAPEVDSIVNVSGEFNAKIRSYEAKNGDEKHAVDLSINNPVWLVELNAGKTDAELAGLEPVSAEVPF